MTPSRSQFDQFDDECGELIRNVRRKIYFNAKPQESSAHNRTTTANSTMPMARLESHI